MVQFLVGLGYGLVAFGVLVGVGLTVLANLGSTVAVCDSGFSYNLTRDLCVITNGSADTATPAGSAYGSISSTMGYLGTGTGGLVNWLPVIIAMVIGGFALSYFVGGKYGGGNM